MKKEPGERAGAVVLLRRDVRSKMYRGIPIYKYFNGALKSHEEEH